MGIGQLTANEGSGEALQLLESLDRVNRIIQSATALEPMMAAVLEEVLEQFACDRVWLLESRSADRSAWEVRMLRARPEYPGPTHGLIQVPDEPRARESVLLWLTQPRLFHFGPGGDAPVPEAIEAAFQIKSVLGMALHPRAAAPFLFGIHQCSHGRRWTSTERGLFHEIGNRLADGLSGLLLVERLRAADARHELAQRVAGFGFWDLDVRGGRVTLSAELARLLELPPESLEMSADEWRTLLVARVHPEAHARLQSQLAGLPAPAAGPEGEFELHLPSGTSRTLRFRGESTRGPGGDMDRVFGTAEDVSDLRTAELRLRESESRYRAFVQHAADAYFVHEPGGRILEVNDEACRSLGYTREELVGQIPVLFDTAVSPEEYVALERRLDVSGSVTFDTLHRRKSGEIFPVEVRIRSITEGQRSHRVSFVRDMSERLHAQKQLQENHARLNAILEGTPDAVFLKDRDGRYVVINTAGAAFVGRPVHEILGRTDFELMSEADGRAVMDHDRRVMEAEEPVFSEERFSTSGVEHIYQSSKSVYRDSMGQVAGLIGVARDVTGHKRMEAQFMHAQRLEAIGRLAGGVAHDFNNLLTVINGYSALLLRNLGEGAPERPLLENIHSCGERAAGLTRQLLTFGRKQVLLPKVVDLCALLSGLSDMLRRLIGEDIELELKLEGSPLTVRVDPVLFEQAIVNLAINARDAMPDGGRLVLEAAADSEAAPSQRRGMEASVTESVRVTVMDTGSGMSEETRTRVFEPFFTTKEPGRGTGLGLAMVYGFVEQSGGSITVDSAPGRGTTFTLALPAVAAPMDEPAALRPADAPRGNETILLVEDELSVRELLRMALEESGYQVLEAAEGEAALAKLETHPGPVHAVVSDLILPGMRGSALLREIRQRRPGLPLLAISGYPGEDPGRTACELAGVPMLRKPFLPHELSARVRALLDLATPPA